MLIYGTLWLAQYELVNTLMGYLLVIFIIIAIIIVTTTDNNSGEGLSNGLKVLLSVLGFLIFMLILTQLGVTN